MADSFFGSIFESSMRASLLILTVLLIKALLGHKLNSKWHTTIWVVVALRLIIPWAPQSPLSLFNAVKPAEKAVKQVWNEYKDIFNDNYDETYIKAEVITTRKQKIIPGSILEALKTALSMNLLILIKMKYMGVF